MENEKDFIEELEEIKQAEAEKERMLEKARRDAEKIIDEAAAEAKRTLEKAADEAEKIGEEALAKARKELSAKEGQIMAKAQKEAMEISAMEVPSSVIRKAVSRMMKEGGSE